MGIKGACPLATLSNVYVDISNNNTNQIYELVPSPSAKIISLRGGQLNEIAVYDIRSHSLNKMFNIGIIYKTGQKASLSYPSILFANRYIIGTYKIVHRKPWINGDIRKYFLYRVWTRKR